MSKFIAVLLLSVMLTDTVHAGADPKSPLTEQKAVQMQQEGKQIYSCRMHSHIFDDKDGKCPICGMGLTPVHAIENGQAVFEDNHGHHDTPMDMMEKK